MLTALVPVFVIILLGYLLKRFPLIPYPSFWVGVERLTYFVLFPCLLFEKLAAASFYIGVALPMAGSLILSICSLSLLLFACRPLLGLDGPAFTSVFQGSIRINTFVGLAGASSLLGASGLTLSAVLLLGMIPLINLICVFILVRYGSAQNSQPSDILLEIFRNPLILSCAIGFLYNLSHLPQPHALFLVFNLLGKAALPLGLLAVGAGLQISSLKNCGRGLLVSSAVKLIVFPLCTAAFCLLLQVQGEPRIVALIFSSIPTAVSAFILARQLGGDIQLMATIVTMQTLLSFLSMPLMLEILGV